MNSILIQELLGLYFVGISLSGLFVQPISRSTLITFVFGLVLFVLAFLHLSLVR